jgi:hypothetical protein
MRHKGDSCWHSPLSLHWEGGLDFISLRQWRSSFRLDLSQSMPLNPCDSTSQVSELSGILWPVCQCTTVGVTQLALTCPPRRLLESILHVFGNAGYGLDDRGIEVRFPAKARDFSLLHTSLLSVGALWAWVSDSFYEGYAAGAWSW